MTTDTEALRAQFERRMNLRGWSEANIRRDGFDYSSTQLTEAWHAYQAGHAAAKAADVGEPVAMVQCHGSAEHPLYTADQLAAAVAAERISALCDTLLNRPARNAGLESEYAAEAAAKAETAAAVAAERDYWRNELHALLEAADAVATNNAHAVSIGSVRYAKHSQTWKAYASLDRARQRASDAIRAGAKETGNG